MAGKAQESAPLTAAQLTQMMQQATSGDTFAVQSEAAPTGRPGGPSPFTNPSFASGGQGLDVNAGQVIAQPEAPARPFQTPDDSPAVPGMTQQPRPAQPPQQGPGFQAPQAPQPGVGVQQNPAYPGQQLPQTLDQELADARQRLSALEQQLTRDAEARKEREELDRIAALPEDQQYQARLDHLEMKRLSAEMKLASATMKGTHPNFVRVMDLIAATADVSMDPFEYRELGDKMEPLLEAIIAERTAGHREDLTQQVVQQWGMRARPEQSAPPPPDDPDIVAYKHARARVQKNGQDTKAVQDWIAVSNRLRLRGIDGTAIIGD